MSSTTMNCTDARSANASHLRPCEANIRFPFALRCYRTYTIYFLFASSMLQNASKSATLPGVKHYCQYCPVAHSLEVIGERWSLLIVRDLMGGPKRYTDLAAGLPGIGTNILASRLKDLEAAGVVHKYRLPPPAASQVYELTEYGRELKGVLFEMARW